MQKIHQNIVQNLKVFFEKNGFKRGVLGLSGGIDSALTFTLAVEALGKENVTVLILPEKGLTKEENITNATALARSKGVRFEIIDIAPYLREFKNLPWAQNQMTKMNLKPRIRMCLLYNFANANKALVLGTSNKSELMIGYGTKYGDLAGDVEVIAHLYKKDVYALARYLKIPDYFLNVMPSAELEHGQTDEEEMGITYAELDEILEKIEKGQVDQKNPLTQMVLEKIKLNQHKIKLPESIEIS